MATIRVTGNTTNIEGGEVKKEFLISGGIYCTKSIVGILGGDVTDPYDKNDLYSFISHRNGSAFLAIYVFYSFQKNKICEIPLITFDTLGDVQKTAKKYFTRVH